MPDSFEDVLYEVAEGRATITINRPDRLNAFRRQTIRELAEAFEAAADDESVGVIVLTGAGERAFCVGATCASPPGPRARSAACQLHAPRGTDPRERQADHREVRGYCIGGGNEMNVIGDLTISGESGEFGQAGPDRSAPPWWTSQILPAVVGEKKAREIVYLTRRYAPRRPSRWA